MAPTLELMRAAHAALLDHGGLLNPRRSLLFYSGVLAAHLVEAQAAAAGASEEEEEEPAPSAGAANCGFVDACVFAQRAQRAVSWRARWLTWLTSASAT